jgi:FtsZ-binding cell division protein ZapB
MYASEMSPDATEEASQIFWRWKKVKSNISKIRIGNLTIEEFKRVNSFLDTHYQEYEFNNKLLRESVNTELLYMEKLIKNQNKYQNRFLVEKAVFC